MKINKHVISIRVDDETLEIWNYLKSIKVSPARIFRGGGKDAIRIASVKYKMEEKKEKLPF
jgi:hypothetical protein